ncbi:MAG TPA: RIP metalloprotease RseP [Povalibacter sp.]|uniref:RIP metalloprotease RseP n=1 Tax=Povalibacter sp. TaxID=1962978 RepID=UPI002C81634A|nr:RIP metalloprotease RseP [Povalibacter sp.]HMN46228.1 RIP metalloprotease RseP [Povalibacter sp.]
MISTDSPAEILTAILTFIVAIGILVAVHEFGHFWVARRLGIKVLRFSIGFGKPLWQRIAGKDQVEYVIAAIPLGGYVKLLDEREGNVPASEAHRSFNRAPVWKRIAVLLAGPAFNLIFAVAMYWVLFTAGQPTLKPIVGDVTVESIAAKAGLKYEDTILAVNGKPVETLESAMLGTLDDLIDDGTIVMRVRGIDGSERDVTMQTGEKRRQLTQADTMLPGLGFDFWRPRVAADVGELSEGEAAARAGLAVGDRIVRIGQQEVSDFQQLVQLIKPNANQQITFTVERNGQTLELPVTIGESIENGQSIGRIGVAPSGRILDSNIKREDMLAVQKYGALDAVGKAAEKTWDMSVFTLKIVGRIVTGDVSLKNLSGPIAIAETTGFAARQGWRTFFSTLALISISLGVLNLLPIPVLDGGQIVYQLAELVKGKPVSERAQLFGQQIGIAVLILMMSLAFYNDIARHLAP